MHYKTVHHFKRGEVIFHQDSPCVGIYCLEAGTVKLFTQGEDGKEIINRIAKPSDIIGHTSALGKRDYIESAKALEGVTCCFIETSKLKEIFQLGPNLPNDLLEIISHELYEANLKNADMVRKNVRERLATYILKMSDILGSESSKHDTFTSHLSREEIASYIGSAHETVIRCISEFKELGYIEEDNRTIHILNKEMLASLGGLTLN